MTPLVRARWTDRIHQEWIENLLANRPDLSRERLEKTRDKMNKLPDCLISDYEGLEHSLELKDPNDRHILAAAIQGGAQAIVTYNLSDFPESQLAKHHIEALHPDEFLMGLVDLDTKSVLSAVRAILGRLKNPPMEVDRYIGVMRKNHLTQFADFLEEHLTSEAPA